MDNSIIKNIIIKCKNNFTSQIDYSSRQMVVTTRNLWEGSGSTTNIGQTDALVLI